MKCCAVFTVVICWLFIAGCGSPTGEVPSTPTFSKNNEGVRWHDSLFKHLPPGLDTAVLVKDLRNKTIPFRQYIASVFNHEAVIYQDKAIRRLFPLTTEAMKQLRDTPDTEGVVARTERLMAYRDGDTVQDWRAKLKSIKHRLSLANHVLVLKGKRKMIISRDGKVLKRFHIDLGFAPVGNKQTDGDGKTPEGIYNLDMKHDRGDKFHRSFWISYPNAADKALAKRIGVKPGVGILVHGTTPARINAQDWTAGCIALQNKDIDVMFDLVADGTVIEIRP